MKRIQNRVGERFGSLVLKAKTHKSGSTAYECLCDCGNITIVLRGNLTNGRTKSCGALECGGRWGGLSAAGPRQYVGRRGSPEQADTALKYQVWNSYLKGAKKRELPWKLSRDYFDTLITQECHYCGSPGTLKCKEYKNGTKYSIKLNGVDRVDNGKGYTEDNCVPCCTICNHAKWKLSVEDFKKWAKDLAKHVKHW